MNAGWRCQKCLEQGHAHEPAATKTETPCGGKHAGFIGWHETLDAIRARVNGGEGASR